MQELWCRGLAVNPSAPADVLLRLLCTEAQACWNDLCEERDLPQEVIDAILSHPDRRVRSHLARNPFVDPSQRARLLGDPSDHVIGNLVRGPRSSEHRRTVRPLPDKALLAMLATADHETLEDLSFAPDARRSYELAATHPLAHLRAWACQFSVVLPDELWQALQTDPDPQVRVAAAKEVAYWQTEMLPADLPATAGHRHWHVLLHLRLSQQLINLVLDRDIVEEIEALAFNASTPPDVVTGLLCHPNVEVRRKIAMRADLTSAQLAALVVDPDIEVRTAVSVHPSLNEADRAVMTISVRTGGNFMPNPASWRQPDLVTSIRHAGSINLLLRRVAACDPRLPAGTATVLAEDDDIGVRVLLAQNHPEAPPQLLLRSFLEYTAAERWNLTTRPGFPTAGLSTFAADPDPMLRRAATLDPRLPADLADQLSRDPDQQVRHAAAASPALAAGRLHDLLRDSSLARQAATNSSLPAATMHAILDEVGIPRWSGVGGGSDCQRSS